MIKTAPRFAQFLLLSAIATLPALAANAVYVRSVAGTPWGQSTNEDAMDEIFGNGQWDTQYYEELDVNNLLSQNNHFIFMEGGDSSYPGFKAFMLQNVNQITTWLSGGGRLLILAAPNDPLNSTTLSLPNDVTLNADAFYSSAASSAYAVDISNAIFHGPYPAAYNFTGNFFSHGYFTGGSVSVMMQSNLNEAVLGQSSVGRGRMIFGSLTTDNFQLPQPAAHGLLINLIYYAALQGS